MNMVMQARGALGGRPRRQSWAEIEKKIKQSPEGIKNKEIKRRTQVKSIGSPEAELIGGLFNLEYGI
jgi:hypothetical protein